MRYQITHHTTYDYSAQVFPEPHYLRFQPQTTAYARLESFDLEVSPAPAGLRHHRDAEGNLVAYTWFGGSCAQLVIRAESVVATREYNPLGFLLEGSTLRGPTPNYSDAQRQLLHASLAAPAVGAELHAFGDEVALEVPEGDVVGFLLALARAVHGGFEAVYREVGPPLPPDETFRRRSGSCRDLSWMLIALLRRRGFAARFVSGYFYFELDPPAYELHAWVEVFLPGAGWFGIDPTHGLATGPSHLPLAASARPARTMPVTGGIRGDATSTMTNRLTITPL